jgi:beta-phosphoglucomutase
MMAPSIRPLDAPEARTQAVIFDLDGVLVTTDELHYRAWKLLADELGIPFDRTINMRLRGVGRMESLGVILERAPRPFSAGEKSQWAARKNEFFVRSLAELTPADVLPGVSALLAQLREWDVRFAVASASRNARAILKRTGLSNHFAVCVDGHDVSRSKPDPQGFLLAAQRLGVRPAHCVVLEDALAGVEAARRAGMSWVGIGTAEQLPGVLPRVASLDVPALRDMLASACQQTRAAR